MICTIRPVIVPLFLVSTCFYHSQADSVRHCFTNPMTDPYVWYANKLGFFVDGKCGSIHMAYIRIRHGDVWWCWSRLNHICIVRYNLRYNSWISTMVKLRTYKRINLLRSRPGAQPCCETMEQKWRPLLHPPHNLACFRWASPILWKWEFCETPKKRRLRADFPLHGS